MSWIVYSYFRKNFSMTGGEVLILFNFLFGG